MIALHERYLESLASKLEALEQSLAIVHADPAAAESIRRIAHAVRGSGATYGFPELTEAGKRVEEATPDRLVPQTRALLGSIREIVESQGTSGWTVLVVEDDECEREIIELAIRGAGRRVLHAETTAEAQRIVQLQEVHLVICDLMLPDVDGRSLILELRERQRSAGTPIVAVSSMANDQVRAECRALGANGFVSKPIDVSRLRSLVADLLHGAEADGNAWSTDPLTGLQNRAGFRVAFDRVRALVERTGQPLALAVIDLDRFKSINDRFGHAVGDEVLRRMSAVVSGRLRRSDILARWGGEEFVVAFPETSEGGALLALEAALGRLRREEFRADDGTQFSVTFSAGVSELRREDELSDALSRADRLLYRAKACGRARVLAHDTEATVPPRTILLVEDDEQVARLVRWQLEAEHFEVVACTSAEDALIRLDDLDVELGILDVNMPGMDGFELLEQMRSRPGTAEIPIVMLTGRGSERDVVRGFELGADDYVVKPFQPTELEARVNRLLKRA